MARAIIGLAFFPLFVMGGCMTTLPAYQEPSSGARVQLVERTQAGRFETVSWSVSVSRHLGGCNFDFLGLVSSEVQNTGFIVPAGIPINIEAVAARGGLTHKSTISEMRAFTPKAGQTYQIVVEYNDIGYGMTVLNSGQEVAAKRPC